VIEELYSADAQGDEIDHNHRHRAQSTFTHGCGVVKLKFGKPLCPVRRGRPRVSIKSNQGKNNFHPILYGIENAQTVDLVAPPSCQPLITYFFVRRVDSPLGPRRNAPVETPHVAELKPSFLCKTNSEGHPQRANRPQCN